MSAESDVGVSVIVVTFESGSFIAACLSSIDRQGTAGVEVLVVDNDSTDETVEEVRRSRPGTALVQLAENRGYAAAANIGAARSRGRHLLFLNPDAVLGEGALPTLARYLDAQPFVAAVGPRFVSPSGRDEDSAFTYPSLVMSWLEFFPWPARALRGRFNGRLGSRDGQPILVDHPLGACMLVRRSAWREVGPFDERFFLYCEEVDWCMRAKRRGWTIASVPGARVTHWGGMSAAAARAESLIHLYESRRLLHRKHRGPGFRALVTIITRVGLVWERRRLAQRSDADARARVRGIDRLLSRNEPPP